MFHLFVITGDVEIVSNDVNIKWNRNPKLTEVELNSVVHFWTGEHHLEVKRVTIPWTEIKAIYQRSTMFDDSDEEWKQTYKNNKFILIKSPVKKNWVER